MLQQMSMLLEPLKIDLAEAGVEAMREVGPGGHFFGCEHTQERYKSAFYEPFLSDWRNFENWTLAGAEDATTRATGLWQRILEEHEPPPTDPATSEALDSYIAKRKEALGHEEPELEPAGL